jgi:hypothetical protein
MRDAGEWQIREPGLFTARAPRKYVLELVMDEETDRLDVTGILEAVARAASDLAAAGDQKRAPAESDAPWGDG